MRARTASAAANDEWHEWNVHHARMRHNKTQPKGGFRAVFHEPNRDSHEPRFIIFYIIICSI